MGESDRVWGAARPTSETFGMWLASIAAVGFMLRVLYMHTVSPPLPSIGDEAFYFYSSNLIAQGHGYSEPFMLLFHGQLLPTAVHPPLWPALLSVLSVFTAPAHGVGRLGGAALELHRLLGCVCGAAVVAIVGLLARRVGGWRVGLLAAALAAAYPRFIVLDGYLSSETVFGLLVGVVLLSSQRFAARPTRRRAVLLGALVGLAALTREEALLLVPVLLIPLAWRAASDRRWLVALTVLGAILVVGPWTLRNYSAFGRFVPIANSGAVIGGANCSLTYYGREIGSWQPACLQDEHPSTNEAVESSRQQAQGLRYAEAHIGRAVLVAGVRLLRVWSLYAPTNQAPGEPTVLWIGTLLYYCLAIAAGYALLALRRRGRPILILIAPAIVVSLASILGDAPERLRYDAELPLLALAAWTLMLVFARTAELRARLARELRAMLVEPGQ